LFVEWSAFFLFFEKERKRKNKTEEDSRKRGKRRENEANHTVVHPLYPGCTGEKKKATGAIRKRRKKKGGRNGAFLSTVRSGSAGRAGKEREKKDKTPAQTRGEKKKRKKRGGAEPTAWGGTQEGGKRGKMETGRQKAREKGLAGRWFPSLRGKGGRKDLRRCPPGKKARKESLYLLTFAGGKRRWKKPQTATRRVGWEGEGKEEEAVRLLFPFFFWRRKKKKRRRGTGKGGEGEGEMLFFYGEGAEGGREKMERGAKKKNKKRRGKGGEHRESAFSLAGATKKKVWGAQLWFQDGKEGSP